MHAWIRTLVAFALLLAASAGSRASFHLWQMEELYSDYTGEIQYLELKALAGGQQFLAGHTLVTMLTATTTGTKIYTFRANLPGDTAGRRMLIGTAGFAALGIVAPDYVVPNGFFPFLSGSVNFAEGADVWTYPNVLPGCNPPLALYRDGSIATPTPTNYAGETGTLPACPLPTPVPPPFSPPPSPILNFQALWWRDPPGSENGWGLNIVHQGDRLFATWFTYDSDGSALWMVMDDVRRVGEKIYFGTVYQTHGAPFSAYDSSRFGAVAVGAATLAFSDGNNGTFTYTVNGITEKKPITKFVFASPVPTCSAGAGPGGNSINYQDLWWRSPAGSENGWGVNIAHQGDTLFATWFTYGADGSRLWLLMDNAAKVAPNTYSGAVYQPRGAPFDAYERTRFSASAVGSATFTFTDPSNGTFTYSVNGVTQSKPITRYLFSSPATTCHF